MLLLELLLGLIRFLLGAALFSFMNVVAWRLPRGMDPLKGRSVCPQCGHTLGAPDLVPVLSWLFLRGRCRHCGAHIPARYLLVELLGGVLALGCTWRYGAAYALPGGLFGMSWAALLALAVCGAVSVLLSPADWLPHIIGALCVSVPMFLLCLVIDSAFGGGDIKLMAAAGLFWAGSIPCWRCFLAFWAAGFTAFICWPPARPTKKTTSHLDHSSASALCWRCFSAIPCLHGTAGFYNVSS